MSGQKLPSELFSEAVRGCFAAVFEDLQRPMEAGVLNPASLRFWAQRNPKDFYRLAAKLAETPAKPDLGSLTLNVYTGVPAPAEASAELPVIDAVPVPALEDIC